jgi:hypothetical protein
MACPEGEQQEATRDLAGDDGVAEGPSRKMTYARSRFFTFSAEGSSEESWMFLDDYERREDFDRWVKAVREDPELVSLTKSFMPEWDSLIVPGSKQGEVWTEVESLRAEFTRP